MTTAEIRNEVDAIIEKTFDRLQKAYQNSKSNALQCDSSLIFPKYRNGELRISEQELRCAFVEEFKDSAYANNKNWHYSIETPTREKYSFSEDTPRVVTQQNGSIYFNPANKKRGFKPGNFDFVIYNAENAPVCLIEFKADCRSPRAYYKDFEKLIHDMEDDKTVVRYFIQLLETKESADKIAEKLKNDANPNKKTYKKHFLSATPKIEYRCHVLEEPENESIAQEILASL